MKKLLLLIAVMAAALLAKSQQYNVIDSQKPQNSSVEILSETNSEITLKLNVNAYSFNEVQTPNGTEVVVTSPAGINYMDKGTPDIPYFTASVCIPAKGKAVAEVIGSDFFTLENISVAPSKGSISRNIDPATVPYEYGKCYRTDAFIPAIEANNSEAFCIRDVRGTSVRFFPFQYNPVQKQLKVYTEITVRVKFTSQSDINEINESYARIDEFESIYSRFFVNYDKKNTRYTQLQDGHPGRMLIICKDTYASAMTDFINWKREKGIETEMVLMSTVGSSASNVQNYITNYFNAHSDLAYILLVGDGADVPSNVTTTGSGYWAETKTSDNQYAFLVGNDHYVDAFIGRFSGESTTHIETQVRKVINYEKELNTDATWLTRGYGSASNEGGGSSGHNQGHGAESDMAHMGYIQNDLESYGYTVTRVNQASGYTSDVAATSAAFNNGIGLACYIGHGDTQEWYSTGYTNTHVNALTNAYKLPYVISVACVNGDFNGNTCFAEAWARASKNGSPTGSIAFLGSTINQDWNPPMTGQDEMVDIIVESLDNNIKRTIGGITFNGYFRMIQDFPSNGNSGDGPNTADTWTIFGDPSTMFRSKTPQEMTITHPSVQTIGQTTFTVNCDADDALVALTRVVDNQVVILGYAYASNGVAEISHTALTTPGTIKLTATAYNKVTYQTDITVIVPDGPYVTYGNYTINDSEGNGNGAADYNETIKLNQTLNNVGVENAQNVNMTISSTSNDVTISDNSESFGSIAADNSTTKNDAFEMTIHNGIQDQTVIPFAYNITCDNSDTHSGNFNIIANAPKPTIAFVSVDDSENGNNNGMLDPGETVKLKFRVSNEGHASMEAGNAVISSSFAGVSLISEEASINTLSAGNNRVITFEASVNDNVESGSNACFIVNFNAGMYSANTNTCLAIGLQIEDWESNSFDSYEWENNSSIPWRIVSGSEAYDGNYCAKSGSIGNGTYSANAKTELIITIDAVNNDNIEFYKKVSCENPGSSWSGSGTSYYDYLAFFIDGTMKGQWAGTSDNWSQQTYPVTAGSHTFKWSYEKDYSTIGGSDCAWIDNIKLPAHTNAVTSIHTDMDFAEISMSIYPNPANDNAYINLNLTDDSNVSINIYNSVGQIVKTISNINLQSGENYVMIETSSLNAGMYIVKANIGNETICRNLSVIR